MLSELRITGFPVDQLSQLAQHKLWGEQLGQSAEFQRAARLFEGWIAHAADAARNPPRIRNQSPRESNFVPPDWSIDIVEVVVVEEPLLEQQLELGEAYSSSRQSRGRRRGGGTERSAAKDKSMWMRVGPTKEGLHGLMQLVQGGIAAHHHLSPEMRAAPAQEDAKLKRVN
jgi:hypothetical protein